MNWLRHKYLWGTLGLVLAGAVGLWSYSRTKSRMQFQTAAVDRGTIQASISATGNCNAVVQVDVGSQVSGNIKTLYADFNTKVKRGQLVALIDPEMFQARVDQARAAVDSAKSAAANAQAMIVKDESDIATAKANLANLQAAVIKAKAAAKDAATKLRDRLALFTQGIISVEDRDTAQSTSDQADAEEKATEAQVDAAQHAIQSAEAQRQVAITQLASAQAQVKQAQASLEQAELDLEHTRILAPVDGTVIARRMDVGQTVAASFQAPTIFQIAQDLTKMQVDTNVDEADVGQVRVGQRATFTVDAYPSQTFNGQVAQIRQAPINVQNVVTYDVVVAVDNSELKLLPGMTANVRILTNRADNVLRVPNAAMRYHPVQPAATGGRRKVQAQTSIWILDKTGSPTSVPVKFGISDGTYTALDGLTEGDRVIVAALNKAAATAAPAARTGRLGF